MDTCKCMAGSLRCSSETITTLLISYTPIQNKKLIIIIKKEDPFSLNASKEKPWYQEITSLMDTFPSGNFLHAKMYRLHRLLSHCPYLDNTLLSQVTSAMQEKGIDFILKCLSQIFGSELVCAFFRDTNS